VNRAHVEADVVLSNGSFVTASRPISLRCGGWQLWRGNQLLVPGASGRYGLCGPDLLGGHSRQGLSGSCLEPELFGAGLVLGWPNYTPGLDFRNDFTILILQHSLLMLRRQKCLSGIPEVDPDEHV
jgi:hypothetical protein